MLPEACIVHQTSDRLRLKLPTLRGDREGLDLLVRELTDYRKTVTIKSGVATGSVVIAGKAINTGTLERYALSLNLFRLETYQDPPPRPLSAKISSAMGDLNGGIGYLTGGAWDLPGTIFIALLTFGIVEILRGNFRLPPWYTAFWYAFGVFTKSMLDKLDDSSSSSLADISLDSE